MKNIKYLLAIVFIFLFPILLFAQSNEIKPISQSTVLLYGKTASHLSSIGITNCQPVLYTDGSRVFSDLTTLESCWGIQSSKEVAGTSFDFKSKQHIEKSNFVISGLGSSLGFTNYQNTAVLNGKTLLIKKSFFAESEGLILVDLDFFTKIFGGRIEYAGGRYKLYPLEQEGWLLKASELIAKTAKSGDFSESDMILTQSLKIYPALSSHPDFMYLKGYVELKKGNFDQAIKLLQSVSADMESDKSQATDKYLKYAETKRAQAMNNYNAGKMLTASKDPLIQLNGALKLAKARNIYPHKSEISKAYNRYVPPLVGKLDALSKKSIASHQYGKSFILMVCKEYLISGQTNMKAAVRRVRAIAPKKKIAVLKFLPKGGLSSDTMNAIESGIKSRLAQDIDGATYLNDPESIQMVQAEGERLFNSGSLLSEKDIQRLCILADNSELLIYGEISSFQTRSWKSDNTKVAATVKTGTRKVPVGQVTTVDNPSASETITGQYAANEAKKATAKALGKNASTAWGGYLGDLGGAIVYDAIVPDTKEVTEYQYEYEDVYETLYYEKWNQYTEARLSINLIFVDGVENKTKRYPFHATVKKVEEGYEGLPHYGIPAVSTRALPDSAMAGYAGAKVLEMINADLLASASGLPKDPILQAKIHFKLNEFDQALDILGRILLSNKDPKNSLLAAKLLEDYVSIPGLTDLYR